MDEKSSSDRSRVANKLSPQKLAANQANAQRSTGPRTADGKARSRLNSLKHGLLASEAVNRTVDGDAARDQFEALVDSYADHLRPEGPIEDSLVEKIALADWRLKRLLRSETRSVYHEQVDQARSYAHFAEQYGGALGLKHPDIKAMHDAKIDGLTMPAKTEGALLLRYEAAANRDFYRALNELKKLQKERKAAEAEEAAATESEPGETSEDPPEDVSSELEKENYQTNPPNREMKPSEGVATRTNGEDPGGGAASG